MTELAPITYPAPAVPPAVAPAVPTVPPDLEPVGGVRLLELGPHDSNPVETYLDTLARASSRRTMESALRVLARAVSGPWPPDPYESPRTHPQPTYPAEAIDWASLDRGRIARLRSELANMTRPDGTKFYQARYINKLFGALRGVLVEYRRAGLLDGERFLQLTDFKPLESTPKLAGRRVMPSEVAALFASCRAEATPAAARDAAMLALAFAGGLRRAEIVALDLDSYDRPNGVLTVHGKRDKYREVPLEGLDGRAALALHDWLKVRGAEPGPLFCRILKSGRLVAERLTPHSVYYLFERRAERAGLELTLRPHDARRTVTGDLLDRTDSVTAADFLGHADPRTTARYDRRGLEAKKRVAALLPIPYYPPDA